MNEPYINRYAFTNYGPAIIYTKKKLTTAQARKIFAQAGLTVERFVPNWSHFIGWVGVIELDEEGYALDEPRFNRRTEKTA